MSKIQTKEKILRSFLHIVAWFGDSGSYHDTDIYKGHGNFCDVYFVSIKKEILQQQVDIYNSFKENYKDYLIEIEKFITSSLTNSERKRKDEIRKLELTFDVIQVPQNNDKYDLVLVCGKTYKRFFFFKKNIDIRVEFQKEKIKSIKRTKDSTKDNS